MSADFLGKLQLFCSAFFFPLKVKIMDFVPITELKTQSRDNFFDGSKQYHTGGILNSLPKYLPNDAYCMIAITSHDLYPGDNWNYVFGWATYNVGVGVFSYYRFTED